MLDQIGIKVIASGIGAFLADLGRAEAAEKHFAATVKKSEDEVGDASKKAAAEVQKAADQKERAAQRAATALKAVSVVATGIFVAGITAAVKSAMNFEESMDQVGAVAQATEKDMKSLRQEALKIGADTSFSAGQAAKAMHELAAGGRSVAKILGGEARAAVALAEAGNYGLAESAKTIATAMDIWKDTTLETNTVVNMLAGAANTSRFGVEDMSMAIAQGGGVAAQAGVSFEDFSTAIAVTASSFASGSDAGTSFKTFLTSLSGSSDIAKEKMAELGLKFYDVQGALLPMPEIVQQLHDKLGPLSQEAQTVALKIIFGNDAFRTAAQLMKMTGEEFAATQQKMRNTSGLDVAIQRMSNAEGGIEQFKGSVETLGISFGTVFIPMVTQATGVLTGLVNKLGELPPEVLVIGTLTGLALAATPALLSMAAAAKTAAGSLGLTLGMVAAIAAPLALFVGGLVAIELIADKMGKRGIIDRIFGSDGPSQAERLADGLKRIQLSIAGLTGEQGLEKISRDMEKAVLNTDRWAAQLRALREDVPTFEGPVQNREEQNERQRQLQDWIALVERAERQTGNWAKREADLTVALYESLGGKTMTIDAAAELADWYYKLDPAARKIVDAETEIDTVLRNHIETGQIASGMAEDMYNMYTVGSAAADELAASTENAAYAQHSFTGEWLASFGTFETAEDLMKAVTDRLKELIDSYGDFNPEVLHAKANIALLTEELGDLERQGLGESDRAVAIRGEIDALEDLTKSYAENEAAIQALSEVYQDLGYLSLMQITPFIESMKAAGKDGETIVAILGELKGGFDLLADGSILKAAEHFGTLKDAFSPEEWGTLMEQVGPQMVQAIILSFDDPVQQQAALDAVNGFLGTTFTLAGTEDAKKLGQKVIQVVKDNISGAEAQKSILAGMEEGLAIIASADNPEDAKTLAETLRQNVRDAIDDPETEAAVLEALEPHIQAGIEHVDAKAEAEEKGKEIIEQTGGGIKDNAATLETDLEAAMLAGITGATVPLAAANALGRAVVDGIIAGITSQAGNIGGTLTTEMAGAITQAQGEGGIDGHSPSRKTEKLLGLPMMQGIAIGIDGNAELVGSSLKDALVGGVKSARRDPLRAQSPSDYTADDLGKPAVEGIAQGIEDNATTVYDSLAKVLGDMVQEVRDEWWGPLTMNTGRPGWSPTQKHAGIEDWLRQGGYYIAEDGAIGRISGLGPAAPSNSEFRGTLSGLAGGGGSEWTGLGRSPLERARMELDAISRMLSDNLKDNIEMTADEIEQMFDRIRANLVSGGLEGTSLAEYVEEVIVGMRAGVARGEGLANKDVQALIEHIDERTDPDRVAWVDPQGRVQFIPRSQLPGPSMDDVARNPPTVSSKSIEDWYLALEDNMYSGTEMTVAEMKQMFADMRKAMEVADFPGAIKAMMEESIKEMEKSLSNLPNATVMGVIAGINAGVKVAAETTYLGTQQFKPPDNNNVDWTILKAEHDRALAERIALAKQANVSLEELDAYIAKQREVYDPDNFIPDTPPGVKDMPGQSSFTGGGRWILHPDGSITEVPEGTFDSSSGLWYHNGAWQRDNPANASYYGTTNGSDRWVTDPVTGTSYQIFRDPNTGEFPDPLGSNPGGEYYNGGYSAPPNPSIGTPQWENMTQAERDASNASWAKMNYDAYVGYNAGLAGMDPASYQNMLANQAMTADLERRIRENPELYGTGHVGKVEGFARGTPFVPQDMLAYLHRGEAVLPEWLNDMLGSWSDMFSGGMRGGFADFFSGPLLANLGNFNRDRNEGIVFQSGALTVNYSGPADMARQVGEDFGDAFLRTLRASGSNALAGRS